MNEVAIIKEYYWLSFVDPGTRKHLGVAIVAVDPGNDPVNEAWQQEVNPGGQIALFRIPDAELSINILYSEKDLLKLGYTKGGK